MKKNLLFGAALLSSVSAMAQLPFTPIDTNYTTTTVVVPAAPFNAYHSLFVGNTDYVYTANGDSALAKQNHDFTGFLPLGNGKDSGLVIVNHEITNTANATLGAGGGMTVFKVVKNATTKTFEVVPSNGHKFHNVDFSAVGYTNTNCGGITTTGGKFLTAEEYPSNSNSAYYTGFQDTSDFTVGAGNGAYSGKTLKRWQNFGWMVQVDPVNKVAERKLYAMGRFSHEGGVCMPDGKTVYLSDDATPGVFFKFVANTANDFTAGQLYAYKRGTGTGSWIALPMDIDSLVDARTIALRKGASPFTRLEWVVQNKGKVYISETGLDNFDWKNTFKTNAPSDYQLKLDTLNGDARDSVIHDYYGRVLMLDTATNAMSVFLEGGMSSDMKTCLSNPDGLALTTQNGTDYLVINEDINGTSQGRSPSGLNICEVFYAKLGTASTTVDSVKRFVVGPAGAETTGGCFSPDGTNYFVNVQHPSSSNPAPFNNSATIVLSGFQLNSVSVKEVAEKANHLVVYPNPASRELYLSEPTDVALYNINGQRVLVQRNAAKLDISTFAPGTYFLQAANGEVHKIIIQ